MGKKGNWFSAVKKVLRPKLKEDKDQKNHKSKKKWFGKHKTPDLVTSAEKTEVLPGVEDAKLADTENEQSKHAYSVALVTAMAAEAAVAAAQAAAEVVRLTYVSRCSGKSKEEIAAIKIQAAFRGHLARRVLRALKGLVRLKSLIQGQSVKRQATTTLRCMQTLARVQAQIRARRIRMSEENQALQRQLQQNHEREMEKITSMGDDWDDRVQSKEHIEANLLSKQEAAVRRERALAYAYSHQQRWKNSSKSANQTFMDPSNPHWGWSLLERWMVARPWETGSTTESNDGSTTRPKNVRAHRVPNKSSPTSQKPSRGSSHQSPSTPPPRSPSLAKQASSRRSAWGGGDDDLRSTLSYQSETYRRHSIAGSSVKDDESLTSSPSVPSYMTPTKSAKAKSRPPSPLSDRTPEKVIIGLAKKTLSYPSSPSGLRRHSGPPKMDISSTKQTGVHTEEKDAKRGASSNGYK